MITQDNPPQFNNQPVILVHFKIEANTPGYPAMYYCAMYEFVEPNEDTYPNIPRVPCPGCARAYSVH